MTKQFAKNWLPVATILLLTLVYLSNLFVPLTGDAGKYAAISRHIVESGDWINLQIHQQAYDQKPHLIFWLGALSFKLFGISAIAFKLPVLLFSFFGFYSTYRLAKLLYNHQTGLLAAVLLASSEIWILFSNDIHTDILMASATAFAIWKLFSFLNDKKTIHFILAFAGIGLAILSKGIIALLFPVFAIGSHLLIQQKYRELFHPRWLLGIPILILFFYPTIAGIYQQLGIEGLHFYFWENNIGRMSGEYKGNNNDFFFYFHTALYIWLPWSLLLFTALYFEGKDWIKNKFRKPANNEFGLWAGIVLFWLLISVSRAKAPHFLLTISPFAAILASKWLIRFFSEEKLHSIQRPIELIQWILGVGLILFAGLTAWLLFPSGIIFWTGWIICLMLGLFVFLKTKNITRIVLISVIGISSLGLSMNMVLFPGMFAYHSTIPACQTFNRLANEHDILHSCNSIHRELFFYCKKPGLYLEGKEQLSKVIKQPNTWLYMDENALKELREQQISFEYFFSFKHKSLTRQSLRFLNPNTREKALKKMYLVKISEPQPSLNQN